MRCAGGWRPWRSSTSGADAEPSRVPARRDRNLNARASASPWARSGAGRLSPSRAPGRANIPRPGRPATAVWTWTRRAIPSTWLGGARGGGGYGLSRYGPITVPARTQRSSPARAGRRWIMMGGAELGAWPLARPSAHTATPRQHSSACPHSAPGGGGNRAADRPSRLERTGPQRRSHQVV